MMLIFSSTKNTEEPSESLSDYAKIASLDFILHFSSSILSCKLRGVVRE